MAEGALDDLDELSGSLVRLCAPALDDLGALETFDRDSDGSRQWDQTNLPRSHEQAWIWLEEHVTKPPEGDRRFLIVETTQDNVVAGSVSVGRAAPRHGRFS